MEEAGEVVEEEAEDNVRLSLHQHEIMYMIFPGIEFSSYSSKDKRRASCLEVVGDYPSVIRRRLHRNLAHRHEILRSRENPKTRNTSHTHAFKACQLMTVNFNRSSDALVQQKKKELEAGLLATRF